MTEVNDIVGWVLDYACSHREFEVIKAISIRYQGSIDFHVRLKVPTVRYMSAIINHIVDSSELELFSLACKLTDDIYNLAKECIPFNIYARLSFGLKMQCLFHHLKEGSTLKALAKLNELIPRTGVTDTHVMTRYEKRFHKVTANFRKFFLPLLANEKQRKAYLKNEYPQEYGEKYMTCLKRLTYQYLSLVEKELPATVIDKIFDIGTGNIPVPPCVAFNILLDYCDGKSSLSTSDLINILTSISPINTQDKVLTDHNFLVTSSTESDGDLFENIDSSQSFLSTQPPSGFSKEEDTSCTKNNYTKLRNSADSNTDLPAPCDVNVLANPDLSVSPMEKRVVQSTDYTSISSESESQTIRNPKIIFPRADERIKSGQVKRRQHLQNKQSKKPKLCSQTVNDLKSIDIKIGSSPKKKEGIIADRIPEKHHIEGSISSLDFSCHTKNSILTQRENVELSYCIDNDILTQELTENEAILEGLVVRDVLTSDTSDDNYYRCRTGDGKSVSDINNISITSSDANRIEADSSSEAESERIPSSNHTELNMSSNDYLTEVLQSIILQKKKPFLQLCVIKLRRNKDLDVMRNGLSHNLYS